MSAPDPSNLDFPQVLRGAFDETNGRLRTDAIATISNVSIAVDMDPSEDGVYIADKNTGNKLVVNADGSINVVVATGLTGINKNIFNELLAVASGATVNLVSYIVPAGKSAILDRIFVSGENIALFEVYLNAIKIDVTRTYFGSSLNSLLDYSSNNSGYTLSSTDTLVVQVTHNRPSSGNFEGRIQIIEIG